jgi:hypothetical protein
MRWAPWLVVAMLAAPVASAGAAETEAGIDAHSSSAPSIDRYLNDNGTGMMIANPNPQGRTWSWEICPPGGGACAPYATGTIVSTGAAAPGTVFKATANDGSIATSRPWQGPVTAINPPWVAGEVRANALVTPIVGTWSGGWEGDFNGTELAACREADGSGCISLTDPDYFPGGCGGGRAVIDPYFTGWYLRVANVRYGPNTLFEAIAVSTPYGATIWPANAITSVSVVGRIEPASGPRSVACGPPPLSSGAAPGGAPPAEAPACASTSTSRSCGPFPTVRLSRRGAARIGCPRTCRVLLVAKNRSRSVRVARTVYAGDTVTVRLGASRLGRLRGPTATVLVYVNGARLAKRQIRLSQAAA